VTDVPAWVEFERLVEVLPWGRNLYTVIRLDPALVSAATRAGTRRVEGTIDDVPVNVGLNRADVIADPFMYVGPALQRRVGVAPGDLVVCRLRPADPDDVPLPDDVRRALVDAGRLDAFQKVRPAQRRRLLQPIEDAVKPATRSQRIAAVLRSLAPE
jgi:hypothetical protein